MNSDSFYAWYDRLPSRKQAEVDNLADEMGLPLYDDCRPDELAQLHDCFVSSITSSSRNSKQWSKSSEVDMLKQELQSFFRDDPNIALVVDVPTNLNDLHYLMDYIIVNDGNEIELDVRRYYHDGTYVGTDVLATGFYSVAKVVNEIEPDLTKWTRMN